MSMSDDMQRFQQALDDYEKQQGLPLAAPPGEEDELVGYLNMPRGLIEKLSATDCAEIAYRLLQFSFHLKRAFNREISRVKWCKARLNSYAANNYNMISNVFGSHEFKLAIIAKENAVVSSALSVLNYAEQRAARLEGLTKSIEALASTLKDNQIAKVTESKRG